jgi:thymidylate kinase
MSFYVIDGPNGSGKTTLIKNLAKLGCKTFSSPSATDLAKMIRPACRGENEWADINSQVQFLLFSAARLDEYIRLVHGKKEIIFADRWWTSTYVYQCVLQGIPVENLEFTIYPEEKIDAVILLDAEDALIAWMNKFIADRPTKGRTL